MYLLCVCVYEFSLNECHKLLNQLQVHPKKKNYQRFQFLEKKNTHKSFYIYTYSRTNLDRKTELTENEQGKKNKKKKIIEKKWFKLV